MRIVFVINRLSNMGGAERAIALQANELTRAGHTVAVVSLIQALQVRSDVAVPVLICNAGSTFSAPSMVRMVRTLGAYLRELKPDVVVSHLFPASVLSAFALSGCTIPLVVTKHNSWPKKGTLARTLEVWASYRASEIHIIAGCVLDSPLGWPELSSGSVVIPVPNPGPPESLAFRDRNDQAHQKYFLFLGRLEAQKNLPLLLAAWQMATASDHFDAKLIIAGAGPLEEWLRKSASSIPTVHLVGEVERMRADTLLRQASALVLTSVWEGLPMVVVESLAAGVPVISTDVGSVAEIVKPGYNGYLSPVHDVHAFAANLVRCNSICYDVDLPVRCRDSVAHLRPNAVARRLEARLAGLTSARRPHVTVLGRGTMHVSHQGWFTQRTEVAFLRRATDAIGVDVTYSAVADQRSEQFAGYDGELPASWRIVPLRAHRTRSLGGAVILARNVIASVRASRPADVVVLMLPSPHSLLALMALRATGRRTVAYWGVDLSTLLSLWEPRLEKHRRTRAFVANLFLRLPVCNLARFPTAHGERINGPSPNLEALRSVRSSPESPRRNSPRIGFVGSRSYRKGFDRFLEVTSALRGPAGEKPTVVIAGRVVPDEEVLDEGISHVEDAGYITDATEYARLLRSLDLLVVPSRSEGRARAIEDALIVGTPVVASQNAGFRPGEARGVDILDDRNLAMWCSELGWVFDAAERRARRLEALAGGQDYFDLYEEPELTLGRAISRLL